jgi:hypothetical protein
MRLRPVAVAGDLMLLESNSLHRAIEIVKPLPPWCATPRFSGNGLHLVVAGAAAAMLAIREAMAAAGTGLIKLGVIRPSLEDSDKGRYRIFTPRLWASATMDAPDP